MIRTLKLKLVLDEAQKDSLLRTMEAYTKAFEHAARWGFWNRVCDKFVMHHGTYYGIRNDIPQLSSTLVQSATRTACGALRRNKFRREPKRKIHSPIRYTWKEAKVHLESGHVSISSVNGRVHARTFLSDYSRSFSSWRAVSSLLVYAKRSKTFYLHVDMEKPDPPKVQGRVVGIDRGLKNAAVSSNNMFFSSSRINAIRGRYAWNRATLQATGTRSAKRRLKQQSGRERRFVTCENHKISKAIVNTDFAVFALEDLSQISRDRFVDKRMRTMLNTWAHFQLESFIRYKAEEIGKIVLKVNPFLTSQTCSRCGWIDNDNRHGSEFRCQKCGFSLHADLNASRNIARIGISEASRLQANQPYAMGNDGDHSGVHSKVLNLVASPLQGQLALCGYEQKPDCIKGGDHSL